MKVSEQAKRPEKMYITLLSNVIEQEHPNYTRLQVSNYREREREYKSFPLRIGRRESHKEVI